MVPPRHVVAGPHCTVLVGPREERAGEHEGPDVRGSLQLALDRGHVVVEAVDVVHVAVLDPVVVRVALVEVVAWHRHLGPIEDAGLVHVVPRVKVRPVVWVVVHREELGPLVPHRRVAEVRVEGGARPTPAVVLLPALGLGEEVHVLELLEDPVALLALDVRVDDRHELALGLLEGVQELVGLVEVSGVPREVLLAVSMLNVEPEHVVVQLSLQRIHF